MLHPFATMLSTTFVILLKQIAFKGDDVVDSQVAGIPIAIGKVLVDAGRGSEDLRIAGTPVYDEERAGVSRGSSLP
jgi:hypothetical protein